MDLPDALSWLEGHIDLERTVAVAGRGSGLSLDRMRELVAALGDPHEDLRTVHVTGTNGKGSTARIATALLGAEGRSVGCYSSPHLERLNERMVALGAPIGDRELADLISLLAVVETTLAERPSYFELLTAAALRWFSDLALEAVVVEVGLLGLHDATNVVHAEVAVVTNIGKDHTDGIGDWRRRIATEKAGIVEPGSTLVLGACDPDLRGVFTDTRAGRILVRGEDFGCSSNVVAVGGRSVALWTPEAEYRDLYLPLHGAHQADNAAAALAAAEAFIGRPLAEEVVVDAFAGVRNPGRFEVVGRRPLVVLDGAHNPPGMAALSLTLQEGFGGEGECWLVLGVLAGRDPGELLAAIDPAAADLVIACTPPSPRGLPASELATVVGRLGGRAVVVPDVADAVGRALDEAQPDTRVVVTGSLYTVGAARSALRRRGLVTD